jgi:hypothetical protein
MCKAFGLLASRQNIIAANPTSLTNRATLGLNRSFYERRPQTRLEQTDG